MVRLYKGIEIPENDEARVEAVRRLEILETPPEREFDDLTELAALVTNSPVAYISIFDDERSWLKSSYGLPKDRPPRPRELSMCAPTICQNELLIVPDMTKAPRYANLPAVVNPPHARFYCAMPLIDRDGFALGTLCVWDPELKGLSDNQQDAIRRLARLTVDKLERRRDLIELGQARDEAVQISERSRAGLARAEEVAHRLLPAAAAVRMLANAEIEPKRAAETTVIWAALDDFPTYASAMEPADLVEDLTAIMAMCDRIAGESGLSTVRTAGGGWIAASGLERRHEDHVARACRTSLAVLAAVGNWSASRGSGPAWSLRIGVHTGPAVFGVAGGERVAFDIWGEAPDIAEKAQRDAPAGTVRITEAVLRSAGAALAVEPAGEVTDPGGSRIATFDLRS